MTSETKEGNLWNKKVVNIIQAAISCVHSALSSTAWKVSKYGVISGPYLYTFHAVKVLYVMNS